MSSTGAEEMTDPNTSQVVEAFKGDWNPKSPAHIVRLICGGFMGATGFLVVLGKLFILKSEFAKIDLILVLVLILAGAAIVFTGTILAIIKALPLPSSWKKTP